MNASAWWAVAGIVGVLGPLLIHWTAQPWARCRTCSGVGTLQDPWSGKWLRHCGDCGGYGRVERTARQAMRGLTGGRLFPNPPDRGGDVHYAGNQPFAGGGRRAAATPDGPLAVTADPLSSRPETARPRPAIHRVRRWPR